ncbi:MAG: hypothetical protein K2H64_04130 [Desulfovibrio sp.]|nr:hypothetical protein [Desulfovibrio sp.]
MSQSKESLDLPAQEDLALLHPQSEALVRLMGEFIADGKLLREGQWGRDLFDNIYSLPRLLLTSLKLRRLKTQDAKMKPPAELGGKGYSAVIKAFEAGGDKAVEELLASVEISSRIKGEAYTVLAKKALEDDPKTAFSYAFKAWRADPAPFRLKWLAFRAYDAEDIWIANAIINILPKDINFSESEGRYLEKIRKAASVAHKRLFGDVRLSVDAETLVRSLSDDLYIAENETKKIKGRLETFRELYRTMISEVNLAHTRLKDLREEFDARIAEKERLIEESRREAERARNVLRERDEQIQSLLAINSELTKKVAENDNIDKKLSLIMEKAGLKSS